MSQLGYLTRAGSDQYGPVLIGRYLLVLDFQYGARRLLDTNYVAVRATHDALKLVVRHNYALFVLLLLNVVELVIRC